MAEWRGYSEAPGWLQQLISERWPQDEWDNAAAVAWVESRWYPGAHNPSGEDSRGLWQINVGPGAHTQWASRSLWDAAVNADTAYELWTYQGWGPWTTAHVLGIVGGGSGSPILSLPGLGSSGGTAGALIVAAALGLIIIARRP